MKVLLLTYYWPPSGGSGVQRWLKFTKYLSELGVEVVVYTVEHPNYDFNDEELRKEVAAGIKVLKKPIFEPGSFLTKGTKNNKMQSSGFLDSNPSLFQRMIRFVRANFFIPDAKKFWIGPSVLYLSQYLERNPVDIVISTGPPHSLHLIANELKRKFEMKWISDFRDPWTRIDYFQSLPLTKKSLEKHRELEEMVLKNSDAVLAVGDSMKKEFERFNDRVYTLTNGYDSIGSEAQVDLDGKFTIAHIGMMNADRNPHVLWNVLGRLIKKSKEFQNDIGIRIIGKCAREVIQSIHEHGLDNYVEMTGYLPHNQVYKYQRSSQLLLLVVNRVPSSKGIITGKVFEYLQSKRPILVIGPEDGDLANIISDTRSGTVVGYEEEMKLEEVLWNYYRSYQSGKLTVESKNIGKYHSKNLSGKLIEILSSV